jgi:hypothetical protein
VDVGVGVGVCVGTSPVKVGVGVGVSVGLSGVVVCVAVAVEVAVGGDMVKVGVGVLVAVCVVVNVGVGMSVCVEVDVFAGVKNFVGIKVGAGVCVFEIVGTGVFVGGRVGVDEIGVRAGVGVAGKRGSNVMVGTGSESTTSRVAMRSSGLYVEGMSMMICSRIFPLMGGINACSSLL